VKDERGRKSENKSAWKKKRPDLGGVSARLPEECELVKKSSEGGRKAAEK